jgi:hypothetical protein
VRETFFGQSILLHCRLAFLALAQIEKADSMEIREKRDFLFMLATSTFLYSFVTFCASLKQ